MIVMCVQDRETFHRLIVKNNAKKRKTYEAFIECVPLLKSLEVGVGFGFVLSHGLFVSHGIITVYYE